MIVDITYLLELRQVQSGKRPVSTLAFDWLFTTLMILFNLGIALDLGSHARFGPDQSVLNEYHMLFYSALTVMGLLLFGVHLMNVRAGYAWRDSLPVGYGITFFGILLFGISGAFDLIGHALWGFEVGVEAVYSPSHFGLFLAMMIICYGPIAAMLTRYRKQGAVSLINAFPGLMSFAVLIVSAMLFAAGFAPLGGIAFALQSLRPTNDNLGYMLAVAGTFFQSAVLFGMLLWMISQIRLPFGSITLIFAIMGLMAVLRQGPMVLMIGVIAGLLLDALYRFMRPVTTDPPRFYAFAFLAPVVLWLTFYLFIILTDFRGGTYLTPYIWIGSSLQNGLIGLALAFLLLWKSQEKPS